MCVRVCVFLLPVCKLETFPMLQRFTRGCTGPLFLNFTLSSAICIYQPLVEGRGMEINDCILSPVRPLRTLSADGPKNRLIRIFGTGDFAAAAAVPPPTRPPPHHCCRWRPAWLPSALARVCVTRRAAIRRRCAASCTVRQRPAARARPPSTLTWCCATRRTAPRRRCAASCMGRQRPAAPARPPSARTWVWAIRRSTPLSSSSQTNEYLYMQQWQPAHGARALQQPSRQI